MIKIYLRTFVIMAGLFFLWLLFQNLTNMGLRLAVADALVKGALFGITLSAIIGTLHLVKARQAAGPDSGPDIYALKQVRELRSALPKDRVFELMRHYLEQVARLTVTSVDTEGGRLESRSGLNFKTFGNKLSVTVRAAGSGGSELTIVARPLVMTTLADFGESLRAADGAAAFLRASEHG